MLLDLVESKINYMDVLDLQDLRDLQALQQCREELEDTIEFPDHEQFRRVDGRDRARTMFAAATCEVRSPLLEPATEPFARPDRLTKQRKGLAKLFRRLGKGFRRPAPAAAPVTHAGTPRD